MTNPRIVECDACQGERGFEHVTGYDPRDGSLTGWIEPCDACAGRGVVVLEAELIEQEDLDNQSAA